MENRKELLEQYMEDGKLPLNGELFARKLSLIHISEPTRH